MTVNGRTLGENIAGAEMLDDEVIRAARQSGRAARRRRSPCCAATSRPNGAVMKPQRGEPEIPRSIAGRALVFDNPAEMNRASTIPISTCDENTVLVLRNAGPVGAPGMPEWGSLPIPKKLLEQGVRDMVRISDARMSGTHYGTCILHVAPEAAVGGPLALVRTGDTIELDVAARTLDIWRRRRRAGAPPRRTGSPPPAALRAASRAVPAPCVAGRTRAATSTSCKATARRPSPSIY